MSVRARRRSEIRELYQPLQSSSYRDAQGRVHLFDRDVEAGEMSDEEAAVGGVGGRGGVWDDTVSEHELRLSGDTAAFALGDDDEEEPPRKKSPALGLQLE